MILLEFFRTRQADSLAAFFPLLLLGLVGCDGARPASGPSAPSPPPSISHSTNRTPAPRPSDVNTINPAFVDVAPALGINFVQHTDAVPNRFFLPEVMGSGIAWIDVDGDGWLDLFLANGCHLDPQSPATETTHCRLWLNRFGKRFEEVTATSGAGISLYGQGCAVADFDADGFDDLYLGGFGSDVLLHNQGDGTFVDVTESAKVSDPEWTSSTLWIDVDGDGDLDLFAVNYLNLTFANHKVCDYGGQAGYCGPGSYDGVDDRVYLNRGDGTFEEAAEACGFRAANGKGLAIAAADFDGDRIPEIYVANDMTANFLFKKRPADQPTGPLYRELATESGCAVSGSGLNEASMGISLSDFDGDGRCDIYLTHYFHTKNTLYKNLGGLIFDDISNWAKVTATSHESLGFGTWPLDFDRDGDPDIFVSNGHVLGPHHQPNEMKPQVLRNDGGMFTDVSVTAGQYFQRLLLGRSVAACDFDRDGDVDLAVSHLNAPFSLLENQTPVQSRPWIGVTFFTRDRRHPVGGKLVLKTDRALRTIPITSGGSYLAACDPRIVVAWPESERLESLEVHWPSGAVSRYAGSATGVDWRVFEGR